METLQHWQHVYQTKDATSEVSWYQPHAELSLHLIEQSAVSPSSQIIDVGGGASTLVDDLLDRGFENVSVLDISSAALQVAQQRLGTRAHSVTWLEGNITQIQLASNFYDVWHDRAVFHFLTAPEDRQRYIQTVKTSVKAGGHLIMATFSLDGPTQCSGLDVVRYSSQSLMHECGKDFDLIQSTSESHHTPFGTEQKFIYCLCRKI